MKVGIWHGERLSRLSSRGDVIPMEVLQRFFGGYLSGDPITLVYEYEARLQGADLDPFELAEQAFRMFNGQPDGHWEQQQSDLYFGAGLRSLSVGDLVVFGEIALACRPIGWECVVIPANSGHHITGIEALPTSGITAAENGWVSAEPERHPQ